ncbi:MAG: CoB--CoM heterodisulfide reductase iron-sulfur subunit A family protein [Bacteroidetes bacterium]|nr:CoB--CoM heterodisulfide reductase iron-sulfur subunit A family protein [Bacteroidota bacterium]
MKKAGSTGVFIYNPPIAIPYPFDITEITCYLSSFPNVVRIWQYPDFPWSEKNLVKMITEHQLERLVIVGVLCGTVKTLFSKAMTLAGKNPRHVYLASFDEYGIELTKDLDRAKSLLAHMITDIPMEVNPAGIQPITQPATLVIGGGIAGIQAALEIAYSNNTVYLVEKSGTIGGKMATFDKTFPTLDCAACILTPKMVEVNQHPFINLMSYAEVQDINGSPGNYTVKILKKARKVNVQTCIGCGTCAEKCPAQEPSEFDFGTTMRKAIYIPFPQAVPNKYMIDAASCIYIKNGKCRACVKACPVPDCINLDEQDATVDINVGNIIVATGYKPFNASRMAEFGYGKFPNVLTSLEFERLLNASGPTGGNIHLRSQDKKGNWIFTADTPKPHRIAIIHCVGSRDKNYNKYCSRVCCMYSLKFSHLVMEKLSDAEIFEYFIDMRSFGKGYEEFYERIKSEEVEIIRGKTAKIEEKDGKLFIRGEDILKNDLIENVVDMVILSVGLEPSEDTAKLSAMMGIPISEGGWFNELSYDIEPTATIRGGIHLAGTCQGPKDIPDSVAQGSAAAAKVIRSILKGTVSQEHDFIPQEKIKSYLAEIEK